MSKGKHDTSFACALVDVAMRCQGDLTVIKEIRVRMKARLDEAAALHGIDPGGVRRLLSWLRQQETEENNVGQSHQQEIDKVYRSFVNGGAPAVPKRPDTEVDTVMLLTNTSKPPRIDDIMKAIKCSRGKAHKLRTLAAARLAAKSSSSRENDERELLNIAAVDDRAAGKGKATEEMPSHNPETGKVSMMSDPRVAIEGNRPKMIEPSADILRSVVRAAA